MGVGVSFLVQVIVGKLDGVSQGWEVAPSFNLKVVSRDVLLTADILHGYLRVSSDLIVVSTILVGAPSLIISDTTKMWENLELFCTLCGEIKFLPQVDLRICYTDKIKFKVKPSTCLVRCKYFSKTLNLTQGSSWKLVQQTLLGVHLRKKS